MELRQRALQVLCLTDPAQKAAATVELHTQFEQLTLDTERGPVLPPGQCLPGHPERPPLVKHTSVVKRSPSTLEGRAALLHSIAHIEFNAINLALDAVWRFDDLPAAYYTDWLKVAEEESLHFSLVAAHLVTLGYAYGDFTAHGSLWEMVAKTTGDALARMALVPRVLEARGLDANPPMRAKIAQAGDLQAAAILDIILRDEIGHVEIGNRWYRHLCHQRGLEPRATFAALCEEYWAPVPRGPFNLEARRQAGFTEEEIADLCVNK